MVIAVAGRQASITDEQSRELRSLGARHQNALIKNRGVAQAAREDLERAMVQEPRDASALRKMAESAILADAAATRTRLQFWLEARQRLGKEPLTKIRQALAKHLHDSAAEEASQRTDIVPAQATQLPAND